MADTYPYRAGEGKQIGTGMLDRAKRSPPPAAAERSAKKPCCHRDPSGGGVPEISSLLSSLSVAKRHSPAAHDHAPLNKRPRYDHHHDLDARMRGLEISCETTDMEQEQGPDWAGFLPELLALVCGRLPLADVPRFGAVCRHWRSCAFPVYPADAAPVLLSATLTAAGAVRCYSPHLHKTFVLAAPPLPEGGRVFSAGAGGWVMVKTPGRTVVFANLLDGSVHETPEREGDDRGFMSCAPRRHDGVDNGRNNNTGNPPNDCCFDVFAVFSGMVTVRVESWGGGGGGWKSVEEQSEFRMSCCCSPVMHKGMLYCLGQEGALGVYDPGEATWSVLPKPAGFGPELAYKNCHLVGSRSELLAVLTGSNGARPIYVLRLDEAKMAWKRVKSLDGQSLFTGTTSSVAVAKPVVESMADKVYLPRLYGRPQVIQAELAASDGRLFFVAKAAEQEQQGPVMALGGGDHGGPWCYDMESDSGGQFLGSKALLQSFWVHLGHAAPPSPSPSPDEDEDEDEDEDDDGMVID
ncbi:hypothetical protein VPH35_094791 [Triticum aestivum]|uniref:KIB1-4 beta-propeller domain-containing protein n=1 Tax=Triticum aestivum TaxID=4565 RepID=A0A3B6MJ29_WHEAT|nr:F-box/kelch-repeat protein At1g57790-like [Triticum aestivum]